MVGPTCDAVPSGGREAASDQELVLMRTSIVGHFKPHGASDAAKKLDAYVAAAIGAALRASASSAPPGDAFSVVDAALLGEAKKYEALADEATEPAEVERLERIAREQWAGHDAVRRLWLRASSAPAASEPPTLRNSMNWIK